MAPTHELPGSRGLLGRNTCFIVTVPGRYRYMIVVLDLVIRASLRACTWFEWSDVPSAAPGRAAHGPCGGGPRAVTRARDSPFYCLTRRQGGVVARARTRTDTEHKGAVARRSSHRPRSDGHKALCPSDDASDTSNTLRRTEQTQPAHGATGVDEEDCERTVLTPAV